MSIFNIGITEEEKVNLTKGTIYQISEAKKSLEKIDVEKNNIVDDTPTSIVILTEYLKTIDFLNNKGMATFYPADHVKGCELMLVEAEAEKEKQLDLQDIERSITKETMDSLLEYTDANNDDPTRVIVRAVEILVSRHPEELNKIIKDIVNTFKEN